MYQHDHRRPISCEAVSQMLSNTLYSKRFFPYYAFNLCAGLDTEGKGAVYSYDAVGSFERCGFGCQGSGVRLRPLSPRCKEHSSPLQPPCSYHGKLDRQSANPFFTHAVESRLAHTCPSCV